MNGRLDPVDLDILACLQADGRCTNQALAKAVGLSPSGCHERVRRLTEEGYLLGYHAELNPRLLGASLLVFIEVRLDRMTPDVFDTFRDAVASIPEVLECHMIAGGFDYLVKMRVADMEGYREFLGKTLLRLPGVRETHTYAVMEEVKNTRSLALDKFRRSSAVRR